MKHSQELTFRRCCSLFRTAGRHPHPPPFARYTNKTQGRRCSSSASRQPAGGGLEGARPGCFSLQPAAQRGPAARGAWVPSNTTHQRGRQPWPPHAPRGAPGSKVCSAAAWALRQQRAGCGCERGRGGPSMRRQCSRGREWTRRWLRVASLAVPYHGTCSAMSHRESARS